MGMRRRRIRQKAVIDASNLAYLQAPRQPRPDIRNIWAAADAAEASGFEAIIIIDPSIRSLMAEPDDLDQLLSDPRSITLPADKQIGRFVLETADQLDALIVSNNTYAEHYEDYPWVEERRLAVASIDGNAILVDRWLKRAG